MIRWYEAGPEPGRSCERPQTFSGPGIAMAVSHAQPLRSDLGAKKRSTSTGTDGLISGRARFGSAGGEAPFPAHATGHADYEYRPVIVG